MIELVGTWGGSATNNAGVVKLMLDFSKDNLSMAFEVSKFHNGEILTMVVTPNDGEEKSLVFESVEFHNLVVKNEGDSKLTFKTITEYMDGVSFGDLKNLVDAEVLVGIEEMK